MNYKLFTFAKKLADLMEEYEVQIVATPVPTEKLPFAYVGFQNRDKIKHAFPNMERCHVSAYDIRTQCLGMTSKEANNANAAFKALKGNP